MNKYNVGDKFVIEIGEVFTGDFSVKENTLYKVKGFRSLVFDKTGLDNLERLDGDYVNENFGELQDEAYEVGRKVGQEEAIKWSQQNETDMYNAGLNDAWQLAQKLWLPIRHGGYKVELVEKIFKCDYFEIPKHFTPQEALTKLEAYEKEQGKIKVGDVVSHDGLMGVVVRVTEEKVYTVTSIGTTPCYILESIKNLKKTGKHINIENLLKQIVE